MHELFTIAMKRKPDAIAILGDLTEEKDRHTARLVNRIVGEIAALSHVCPLLIMMGNHDWKNEGHPFFAFVSQLPNIAWVDKVSDASQLPKDFRSIFAGCILLPHTHNYERDWKAVKLPFNQYRFVFAHQTFDGSMTPHGRALEGIPASVFPKNAKVISGDVHTPQVVGPVTYVGAPYTVDFGDEYDPRMLEIDGHQFASVSLKQYPQKRLLTVDDYERLTPAAKAAGIKKGDILKVRIEVEDMGRWPSTHTAISAWCEDRGLKLYRAEPILAHKAIRRQHRVRPDDGIDDKTLIKQFAKRHDLDEKTLKTGLELLK